MLNTPVSSGIPALDTVCNQLLVGDNVVWRTAAHSLYTEACTAILRQGRRRGWPLIYFRFANHAPLTTAADVEVIQTRPEQGFEHFISEVHRVIARTGMGGVYIFDSLSDLQEMFFSDRMIGCFFELTCPYLRRMETIAYFMLDPAAHSRHATEPIRRTTQVWLDAFMTDGPGSTPLRFLQPVKTWQDPAGDVSPLFRWDPAGATEIHDSATESAVRQSAGWNLMPSASTRQIDVWDTVLMRFEDLEQAGAESEQLRGIAERMLLSTDPRMLELIRRFIQPADITAVWKRMVGTGQIGGKAVGMLLAQSILRVRQPQLYTRLEQHDTFFIGSDVFYTYLVENDCWWDRRRLHAQATDAWVSEAVEKKLETGAFPPGILQGFREILEYFGNAPIIVRSSSLLEDNFGNAFAGKYESFFCANQGSAEERLQEFLQAVRTIYAGTVSREALDYRRERGVLDRDEQMALLVQRVSGRRRGSLFFPDLAGVGLSYKPYVWHPDMDPHAGMSRMVVGLGTRAVDRTQDDTARIAAHDQPTRRPDTARQHYLDAVDLETGSLRAVPLRDPELLDMPPLLTERDWRRERTARAHGMRSAVQIGMEELLREGTLPQRFADIGRCLEQEYGTPVEFEYTGQWQEQQQDWLINLVQCRPFQITTTSTSGETALPLEDLQGLSDDQLILRTRGPVIGHGRHEQLHAIVWVDPEAYSRLDEVQRYMTAELLGQRIQALRTKGRKLFLFGPGRWGTSSPSMGVPVRFGQIRGTVVLGELDWMHDSLSPDLSLGTHFFHDLVEDDVLYVAIQRETATINWSVLESRPETAGEAPLAAAARAEGCIRSYIPAKGEELWIAADPAQRECTLYRIQQ